MRRARELDDCANGRLGGGSDNHRAVYAPKQFHITGARGLTTWLWVAKLAIMDIGNASFAETVRKRGF